MSIYNGLKDGTYGYIGKNYLSQAEDTELSKAQNCENIDMSWRESTEARMFDL